LLKNVLYITSSVVLFFGGLIFYGIILNLREVPLADALSEKGISTIDNLRIEVDRSNYKVEIYSGKIFIKSYKAVFGKNSDKIKTNKSDQVTPLGDYKVCAVLSQHKYHKYIQLSYPNEKDAGEALTRGYINKEEFDAIMISHKKNECPPLETKLGANIGIHGIGEYDFIFKNLPFTFNWTDGSIALSNKNIDELTTIVKIGTPVRVTY
jgi:murein L,D-transpeptidase YafK